MIFTIFFYPQNVLATAGYFLSVVFQKDDQIVVYKGFFSQLSSVTSEFFLKIQEDNCGQCPASVQQYSKQIFKNFQFKL